MNVDEKKRINSRIYELDILRGIGIIGVMANHIACYINLFSMQYLKYLNFPSDSTWGKKIFEFSDWFLFSEKLSIPQNIVRAIFVITVGISFSLSRNNFKRGIRLLIWALIISSSTLILYEIVGDRHVFITFGILHALAISILISHYLFTHIKDKYFYLVSSIICGVIGYIYFKDSRWVEYGSIPLYKIIIGEFIGYYRGAGTDSFPGLLILSIVLFGIYIGKQFYKDKKSIINLNYHDNFLSNMGRNSLFYYIISRLVFPLIVLFMFFLFTLINKG